MAGLESQEDLRNTFTVSLPFRCTLQCQFLLSVKFEASLVPGDLVNPLMRRLCNESLSVAQGSHWLERIFVAI